ncbi:hypothetical protein EUA98_12325 [Pengzhenrongella frigida]|uniref:Uncharacterized protein n=2 Tax=Pengzhenrongella frigida TaxID=1259133 RepID=A0A4Q5N248_9MICO|nr:hypothetical protein EUA98_12325 [Cellulomonas sp. HLT2-17]
MTHDGSARFNPESRPPLDLLPKALADLLTERDRLARQTSAALAAMRDLEGEAHDIAARQADADTAATAARAGKAIPKATATPKLEADRTEAARNLAAQQTAFTDSTNECSALAGDIRWPLQQPAADARAKARTDVAALVDQLATAIETAVAAGAVTDWFNGPGYYAPAQTWLTDAVPDSARYGLGHHNTTPYSVRSIIAGAALTVLED